MCVQCLIPDYLQTLYSLNTPLSLSANLLIKYCRFIAKAAQLAKMTSTGFMLGELELVLTGAVRPKVIWAAVN